MAYFIAGNYASSSELETTMETTMLTSTGKKKQKCKNCEGRGLVKQGDKKVKCQRCGGTGFKSAPAEPAR